MGGEALKGHLDLLLLAALKSGPAHGYAVIRELADRSGGEFELPEGTIYPALHRLERDGLIRSDWSEASGRRRRVYSLTRSGERALKAKANAWQQFARGMAGALEGTT
jgi:PadR family transcriptional regulator PadR